MTMLIKTLAAVAAGTVLAASALAQSAREVRGPSPFVAIENEPAPKLIAAAQNATSADQIEHHIAKIDGTRFHYVTAGTGDPVLLIPGWPESWIAWRKVLPLLVSAGRRVVVIDPKGFGESDKPAGGYDLDTAALEEYPRQYSAAGAMRAGFAWYRANFDAEGLVQAKARAAKRLTMPVLALGGSEGVGDALRATVATIGDRVQGGSIAPREALPADGCGHFHPEECPDELTEAVLKFWQSTPRRAERLTQLNEGGSRC